MPRSGTNYSVWALPAPDAAAYAALTYEAPQGEIEHTIAAIWHELLGLE
ncbi:hypothetical protein [Xanthomonas sp. MUS 060]|nr:hypothetical protein [Xanthomonas sp. MUS 060]